jgi:hypothetical protein
MNDETGLMKPPNMRRRLMVVAIGWVIIGALGACLAGLELVPDVRAARGDGITGTFTLTEPDGCDRLQPPKQRCSWFGDFRGDNGKTVHAGVELAGGLPPGAQAGDTVAARDAGDPSAVYRADDRHTWQLTAVFFALFSGAFLVGLLVLQPWTWRSRLRR